MKYLIAIFVFSGFVFIPAFAQEQQNPSLVTDTIEIPFSDFGTVSRDSPIVSLDHIHSISWQIAIDNNLEYTNPDGIAVIKFYDKNSDKFIEIGMGAPPDDKFWVAVKTDKEGYVIVERDLERGWYPSAKIHLTFTENGGLSVNNGARITVASLNIGSFEIGSYSVYGLEGSTDPPSVDSGIVTVDFISGDPSKNVMALFPFYLAAAIGIIVGVLFLTKKRS